MCAALRVLAAFLMFGAWALVVGTTTTNVEAARGITPATLSSQGDELIIFETEACIYCELFRRDVLPSFRRSQRSKTLSIRFVDAYRAAGRRAQLSEPLTAVPTFVLIRRGREVGRITGYTGPSTFFPLINQMVRDAR